MANPVGLPEGFQIDQASPQSQSGLPPGFSLDAQPSGLMDKIGKMWEHPPEGPSLIGLARKGYDAITGAVDSANALYPQTPNGQITEQQAQNINTARDALPVQSFEAAQLSSPVTPTMRNLQFGKAAIEMPPAPSAGELKAAAKQGYDAARKSGIELKPESLTDFSTQVKTQLNGDGINEVLAPKTFGVLDKIGTAPAGATVTTDNFRTLQRSLGLAAKSTDPTERMAAARALEALNGHLENIPSSSILRGTPADLAEVSKTIKTANANYAASKRSDLVQGKVDRAELNAATANSGQNLDNSLRQQVKSILTNPKALRGFSEDEKSMMMKVAAGTAPGNIIRHVGNLLGGGGGLGALTTGAAATYATGPVGMAAPLAGWALKKAGNAITARNVAKLDELVRSRSPLAQQQFQKAIQEAGGRNANSLQLLMSAAMLQDPTGKLNRAIANMFRGGTVPAAADGDQSQAPRL